MSTTELTEQYLAKHPSIKDCLVYGIVNYSKLARQIAKELGIQKKTSMEAILIACRRYEAKIKKESIAEKKILKILKESELEIKNKIIAMIIDKKIYLDSLIQIEKKIRKNADTFYAIEGTTAFTIIISEKHLEEIKKLFERHILRISQDLAMITLKSPKEIEETPGVVGYIYSLFANHGINVKEELSCWTDLMILIDEKDIAQAMQFLKF